MNTLISQVAALTGLAPKYIQNTLDLLAEGATIPFISRYRKEATGGMDEVQIARVKKEATRFEELTKRKEAILKSVREQEKLTPQLEKAIQDAATLSELEDLYLPYKPKKKTKAQQAIENGLLPLAQRIWKQGNDTPETLAEQYTNEVYKSSAGVKDGVLEIMAEWVSEDKPVREYLRDVFVRHGVLSAVKKRGTREGEDVYRDYFEYTERWQKIPSHRFLACMRGAAEGHLNISVQVDTERSMQFVTRKFVRGRGGCAGWVEEACGLAFDKHLQPHFEKECLEMAREKADEEAIKVFGSNLRQLLLAAPLGPKRILAIDPGFRTGCKVVCLDEQGRLLHNETIYPHPPQKETAQAAKKIRSLTEAYKIEAIAIGNGTAGRETEDFIQRIVFPQDTSLQVFMVNEAGASIYSASAIAREEFPQYDVTVRGSVSIGRRLMDPLAELVKIDPKSIGVGQYQHDVNQTLLKDELDAVVISCVNSVGVNLNTASKWLLSYVSGLGPSIASNIVEYREKNGTFASRDELHKVPRLGPKAFEQCAGFLRIPGAKNPLDNSAVHPEQYKLVEKMAADQKVNVSDLLAREDLRKAIPVKNYISEKAGEATLRDIMAELSKPGRDPRARIKVMEFDRNVRSIEDLQVGMELNGIVSNITNFGAFVDIGVKQDGLVHLSQMADRFIKDPNEVVHLQQQVRVKVTEVDVARKRISLTMKL
ncbi:MAG: RNA-binding transcriptional accessory protein [Bacteroidia bacterium]|nr:RNA-binding transcriptional accessory protein [Bacteroidia bacterium]